MPNHLKPVKDGIAELSLTLLAKCVLVGVKCAPFQGRCDAGKHLIRHASLLGRAALPSEQTFGPKKGVNSAFKFQRGHMFIQRRALVLFLVAILSRAKTRNPGPLCASSTPIACQEWTKGLI